MKLVLIFGILFANAASAETLKCWNTYSKKGSLPLIVANIVSDTELDRFELNRQEGNYNESEIEIPAGAVKGELITSNRSPYKGAQEFYLDNGRLLLPARLDAQSLIDAQKNGIGMGAGENGVIIGSWKSGGDGAGNHFSIRLRCRAYAR